jgi:hypothetical protein
MMFEALGIAVGAVLTLSTLVLWGFAVLIYARFMKPRPATALLLLAIMTAAASAAAIIWWGAFFDALEMNTALTIVWYAGIALVVAPFVLSLVLNRELNYSEANGNFQT